MASDMVTITCTEEHAKVIQTATELLMRLHLKQPWYIADVMMDWPVGIGHGDTAVQVEKHDAIIAVLEAAFQILDPRNEIPAPRDEALAYEVYGMLRHKFYVQYEKNKVDYANAAYPPLNNSGLKPPKVEFGSVDVVRCANCKHCFSLKDTDPRTPCGGDGEPLRPPTAATSPYAGEAGATTGDDGFYCEMWDMDMYSPAYMAEEFYCADGERR